MQVTCISKVLICHQQRLTQGKGKDCNGLLGGLDSWAQNRGKPHSQNYNPNIPLAQGSGDTHRHHHWPQFSRTWTINTNTGD